jgi:hypothetical protein
MKRLYNNHKATHVCLRPMAEEPEFLKRVLAPVVMTLPQSIRYEPLLLLHHADQKEWCGCILRSAGAGEALHRRLQCRLFGWSGDAGTRGGVLSIAHPEGQLPVVSGEDHDAPRWVRLDGKLYPVRVEGGELCQTTAMMHLDLAQGEASDTFETYCSTQVMPMLRRLARVFFRHERMLQLMTDTLSSAYRVVHEVVEPATCTTHTEIQDALTGEAHVLFDLGLVCFEDAARPTLAITFLEIRRGGPARIQTAVKAFADVAMQVGWSMDQDGLNIQCVPLPGSLFCVERLARRMVAIAHATNA